MTAEEADKAQQWAGMDGATAWHLIDRHADNWNETGEMMNAWLRANFAAERTRLAERVREEAKHWQAEGQKDTRDFEICALLIERSNALAQGREPIGEASPGAEG